MRTLPCERVQRNVGQMRGRYTPNGNFDPTDEDVQLRAWIRDHVGDAALPRSDLIYEAYYDTFSNDLEPDLTASS